MPKKDTASKIFLFLVTTTAVFISTSGFLTSGSQSVLFQLLFLPVTLYLLYTSFAAIKYTRLDVVLSGRKLGLLFYLIIFSVLAIMAVGNIAKLGQNKDRPASEEKTVIFTPSPTPSPIPEKILTVKTENPKTKINIREAPSIFSKVIGKVLDNEEFVFMGQEKDWYKIKFGQGFGYLHQDYVAAPND